MTDVAVINTGMAETVRDTAGSGIVYTATIKQAEQVTTLHIRFIVHYAIPGRSTRITRNQAAPGRR